VGRESTQVLDAATPELAGPIVRTTASVIGKRRGESVIVATTDFGYTVTALVSVSIAFAVRPRGWLKKTLAVAGAPAELVRQILDGDTLARLAALEPVAVELGAHSLRLERRYGDVGDVATAIELVATLATRVRKAAAGWEIAS
jgi:hypothetical protein